LPQSACAAIDATPRQNKWAQMKAEEEKRVAAEKAKADKAAQDKADLAKMSALTKAIGAQLTKKVTHMLKIEQDRVEFQKQEEARMA